MLEKFPRHGDSPRPWWMIRLYQVLVLAAVLGIWELASDRWIRELWISRPTLIGEKLIEWFGNGFIILEKNWITTAKSPLSWY